MPRPRKELISLHDTPYYHVTSRCVRRSFLCGTDKYTGKNFNHRKQWILDRLDKLTLTFTIHICSFVIMDNHYHSVLKIDRQQAIGLSEREVVEHWKETYQLPQVISDWYNEAHQSKAHRRDARRIIKKWRKRLYGLDWFMRSLNEPIARWANAEDECTGRFWQGRYKSQALLDHQALLTGMVYVDLNPVRAGVVEKPEDSEYTSIYARIGKNEKMKKMKGLMPFDTAPIDETDLSSKKLPFTLEEYLDLVDWSGRVIVEGKKGYIPADIPPILDRLEIDPDLWCEHIVHFKQRFHTVIGPIEQLKAYCERIRKHWVWGMKANAHYYPPPV